MPSRRFRRIGYRYIALGGMVPLKTPQILACLEGDRATSASPRRGFHLLGITRTERVNEFSRYGVASFDSTSPFRQSFKDDRDNYHTLERNYVAIRVMQIDGNLRLKRRILAGELDQNEGRRLEQACLSSLAAYDRGEASLEATLDALDCLPGLPGRARPARRVLSETLARAAVEVLPVRGVRRCRDPGRRSSAAPSATSAAASTTCTSSTAAFKRNSRRRMSTNLRVPALEIVAEPRTREVYSFGVDGKMLHRFAADLARRPKRRPVDPRLPAPRGPRAHQAIRSYLESPSPMIPNGIVVAFDERVRFESRAAERAASRRRAERSSSRSTTRTSPGWIVDGQQRAAAIRDARIEPFPIMVNAFITEDVGEQRAQFILVNSTKPLPKGLIHELLPSTEAPLPLALHQKRLPALLLERLNFDADSPLRGRIRTPTSGEGTIKDNSILKMIENSISDGALYPYRFSRKGGADTDGDARLAQGLLDGGQPGLPRSVGTAAAPVAPDARTRDRQPRLSDGRDRRLLRRRSSRTSSTSSSTSSWSRPCAPGRAATGNSAPTGATGTISRTRRAMCR